MPRATRFLKPKYLSADDVREFGPEGRVTSITNTRSARINNEERLLIFFDGIERAYACNQSNLQSLLDIHEGNEDTSDWHGTKVRLYVDETVTFRDEQRGGIVIERVTEGKKSGLFGK